MKTFIKPIYRSTNRIILKIDGFPQTHVNLKVTMENSNVFNQRNFRGNSNLFEFYNLIPGTTYVFRVSYNDIYGNSIEVDSIAVSTINGDSINSAVVKLISSTDTQANFIIDNLPISASDDNIYDFKITVNGIDAFPGKIVDFDGFITDEVTFDGLLADAFYTAIGTYTIRKLNNDTGLYYYETFTTLPLKFKTKLNGGTELEAGITYADYISVDNEEGAYLDVLNNSPGEISLNILNTRYPESQYQKVEIFVDNVIRLSIAGNPDDRIQRNIFNIEIGNLSVAATGIINIRAEITFNGQVFSIPAINVYVQKPITKEKNRYVASDDNGILTPYFIGDNIIAVYLRDLPCQYAGTGDAFNFRAKINSEDWVLSETVPYGYNERFTTPVYLKNLTPNTEYTIQGMYYYSRNTVDWSGYVYSLPIKIKTTNTGVFNIQPNIVTKTQNQKNIQKLVLEVPSSAFIDIGKDCSVSTTFNKDIYIEYPYNKRIFYDIYNYGINGEVIGKVRGFAYSSYKEQKPLKPIYDLKIESRLIGNIVNIAFVIGTSLYEYPPVTKVKVFLDGILNMTLTKEDYQSYIKSKVNINTLTFEKHTITVVPSNDYGDGHGQSITFYPLDDEKPVVQITSINGNFVNYIATDYKSGLNKVDYYISKPNTSSDLVRFGGAGVFFTTIGDNRVRESISWATLKNDALGNPLKKGTLYWVDIIATDYEGNTSNSVKVSFIYNPPRPSNFYWEAPKIKDEEFNVTADEWNAFISKINEFRIYSGKEPYEITSIYKDINSFQEAIFYEIFTARQFNQATTSIKEMITVPIPIKHGFLETGNWGTSDIIYASEINEQTGIVYYLNSIP